MNPFPPVSVGRAPDPAGGSSGGLLRGGSAACAVPLVRAWFRPVGPGRTLVLASGEPGTHWVLICHSWLHPHTERELWSQGHSSAQTWTQKDTGPSASRAGHGWPVNQQRGPLRPGSGSVQGPSFASSSQTSAGDTARPPQAGVATRGARCPGASFLAPRTFLGPPLHPCPKCHTSAPPWPGSGQRVTLPPVGLWGNSGPTEAGTPPARHVWSHSNPHIWGKEAFVFQRKPPTTSVQVSVTLSNEPQLRGPPARTLRLCVARGPRAAAAQKGPLGRTEGTRVSLAWLSALRPRPCDTLWKDRASPSCSFAAAEHTSSALQAVARTAGPQQSQASVAISTALVCG